MWRNVVKVISGTRNHPTPSWPIYLLNFHLRITSGSQFVISIFIRVVFLLGLFLVYISECPMAMYHYCKRCKFHEGTPFCPKFLCSGFLNFLYESEQNWNNSGSNLPQLGWGNRRRSNCLMKLSFSGLNPKIKMGKQ